MFRALVKAMTAALCVLTIPAAPVAAQNISATVYYPDPDDPPGAGSSITLTPIYVKAQVGGRCGFAQGQTLVWSLSQPNFDVTGFDGTFNFVLECTGPSNVAVVSLNGGLFQNVSLPSGYTNTAPYDVGLHLVGNGGASVAASCQAASLVAGSSNCTVAYGGTGGSQTNFTGPADVGAGLNQNIFYNVGAPTPNLFLGINTPVGYTIVDFSGNNSGSDALTMTFDVTLPPNLDVTASKDLAFNVNYHCSGTGGGQPFDDTGTIPNALVFPIKVLSGLQASFSGSPLDFGDVGTKTDTDISSDQLTYTKSGWVNVRSSGAYTVTMASQNGYRLTYPGGDVNTATQRLNYTAHFAGETVSSSSTTFTPVSCTRAGLAVKQIPLTVELNEGGKTKAPSPDYQDILTITVTPSALDAVGTYPCAN